MAPPDAVRYVVPADTPCCVSPASGRARWKPHRTTCAWVFDAAKRVTDRGRVFRCGEWLLHVCDRFIETEDAQCDN